jgi:HSP20 family molecular chaperone IbpA
VPVRGRGAPDRFEKDPHAMSKLTLTTHPYLLGFDQLERLVERTARASSDGYPPYNIERTGESGFRITLAVAGFAQGDLSITLEDRQLAIRGRQSDEEGRVYLHRGIAARQFQRAFVLAEGVEVTGARMENGLLHVDLNRSEPRNVVRTIQIDAGRGGSTRGRDETGPGTEAE